MNFKEMFADSFLQVGIGILEELKKEMAKPKKGYTPKPKGPKKPRYKKSK